MSVYRIFVAIILGGAVVLAGLGWFLAVSNEGSDEAPAVADVVAPPAEPTPVLPVVEPEPVPVPALPTRHLIAGVLFTVQAPSANWSDPVFQDACEEASILMASAWVSGTTLTPRIAEARISTLAQYQVKRFGHSVDTSIVDTEAILRDFLSVETTEVKRGITATDIREALADERIVIVPTDGRKLRNPNFRAPGPPRHMLVIVGYDTVTDEFIVNDPGTRKGEGYRYPTAVIIDAILDYETGKHVPATSKDRVMLMVWRPDGDALQK